MKSVSVLHSSSANNLELAHVSKILSARNRTESKLVLRRGKPKTGPQHKGFLAFLNKR